MLALLIPTVLATVLVLPATCIILYYRPNKLIFEENDVTCVIHEDGKHLLACMYMVFAFSSDIFCFPSLLLTMLCSLTVHSNSFKFERMYGFIGMRANSFLKFREQSPNKSTQYMQDVQQS